MLVVVVMGLANTTVVVYLYILQHHPRLQTVNFSNNNFGDSAASHFSKMMGEAYF
jgi:hypothetical protein